MTYEEKLKAAKQTFESQVELCKTLGFPEPVILVYANDDRFAIYEVADRKVAFGSSVNGKANWGRFVDKMYHLSTDSESEQLKWLMGGE